jgi:hypothetical protein
MARMPQSSPTRRALPRRLTGALAAWATTVAVVALAGCDSSSSDDLAAKPPDYVDVVPAGTPLSDVEAVDQSKSSLVGPNFGLRIDTVGVTDAVSETDADLLGLDEPFRAADGHQLLLVRMSPDPLSASGRWDESKAKPRAEVVVGGQRTALRRVPAPGSMLVVSAAEDEAARLDVTDRGRTQSINLRTGARAPNAVSSFPSQELSLDYDGSGSVGGYGSSRRLQVAITASAATLEAYVPGLGWAKKGRRWLVLDLSQVSTNGLSQAGATAPLVGFFLDPAESFHLSWDGGGTSAHPDAYLNASAPAASYIVVFDVPESFRTGTLSLRPEGPMYTYTGVSTLASYTDVDTAPGCGGQVVCLDWQRRPPAERIRLHLEE